ncbi:MAG TPA: YgaP-like transmembrane domain [Dehalococcoidia bacterium]|nr:YgaP-like transmembrane domain [Dehalococcoidia bacterium]
MYLFARFMTSVAGRWFRIFAGVAMIAGGLVGVGGPTGLSIAALGLIPLAAGAGDICMLAPMLGTPFGGAKVRAILGSRDSETDRAGVGETR